jgi:16S rRNA (cytosine967-C5)-methyltransferase
LSVSPARQAAYRILCRVEAGRGFAVDLLQGRGVSHLQDADRRLATELVMGTLRWRGELDFQIERFSGRTLDRFDPEVVTVLRLGVYQVRFLEKIPKAAAVNDAVEMIKAARKRSAAGLVNAVLRKCPPPVRRFARTRCEDLDLEARASVERTVPTWLFRRWAARAWGVDRARDGASHHRTTEAQRPEAGIEVARRLAWMSTQVPPTTLRVAGGKADLEALQRELAEEGIRARPGQYSARALVIESGSVQASKAVRKAREHGCVVIQDEASQLVGELLGPRAGQRVLDLCAAPGVKAGQIAQALGRGTLVACDVSASRLRTMARLLPHLVRPAVRLHMVRLDARQGLPFGASFDRILLDVPCSGTGTLARNPESKWRLLPRDIPRFAAAQTNMLKSALPLVALGGRLVYATCSLEPEENEEVVETVMEGVRGYRVLSAPELTTDYPTVSSLLDVRGFLHTRPDLHAMDGFFAAVIARN